MSERDEMRKLINLIEKGAAGASVEQNVEDLKLFANTASLLANKIDAKIKGGAKVKYKQANSTKLFSPKPKARAPKVVQQKRHRRASALPQAKNVAKSGTDIERLKRIEPQPPRSDAVGGFGSI